MEALLHFAYCCSGGQIKYEVIGRCGTYGGDERCLLKFWWGNVWERGHLKDLDADGRIILKGCSGSVVGDLHCVDVAEDRDR